MTDNQNRPLPTSTVQAAGQAASDIVGGLKNQPALLAIVVLNLVAIVAAIWFLRDLNESSKEFRNSLIAIVAKCINHGGQ